MDEHWESFVRPVLDAIRPQAVEVVGEIRLDDSVRGRYSYTEGTVPPGSSDVYLVGRTVNLAEFFDHLNESCRERLRSGKRIPVVFLLEPDRSRVREWLAEGGATQDLFISYLIPGFGGLLLLFPSKGFDRTLCEDVAEGFALGDAIRQYCSDLEGARVRSLEQKRRLEGQVDHHFGKWQNSERRVQELEEEKSAIRHGFVKVRTSRIYKFSLLLWKLKVLVCPKGSLRARALEGLLLSFDPLLNRLMGERSTNQVSLPRAIDGATLPRHDHRTPTESQSIRISRERWRECRSFESMEIAAVLDARGKYCSLTVVVAIYDAFEDVKRCLSRLLMHTPKMVRILLVDDGSTDPRIGDALEEYERYENISVLRNAQNLGYVRTVNRGLEACKSDVILLNSDTIVTPRWTERLFVAAYVDKKRATVTAISNAAGAFAVPELGVVNPTPPGMTHEEVSRVIAKNSTGELPGCPTGNGFCMYVKREALDEVGHFDAKSFPRGYGEENDFCMRLTARGWNHAVDDTCFIYHRRSASFGDAKDALIKEGRAVLDRKYPDYTERVREFVKSERLSKVGQRVRESYALSRAGTTDGRARILFVLHEGSGGTPATTVDLISDLHQLYECFVLTATAEKVFLRRYDEATGSLCLIDSWCLHVPWNIERFHNPELRDIYFNILVGLKIELVHVRHLICHSFDLPQLCHTLSIPAILSFHDFYLACPSIHLIDDNGNYCGGTCTETSGQCLIPSGWLKGLPVLKGGFLSVWREQVRTCLSCFGGFVTTSRTAFETMVKVYPELMERDFRVIEHGRDFEPVLSLAKAPRARKKVRILVPGSTEFHKGGRLIRQLVELDRERRDLLEFHFIGKSGDELADIGVHHGPYKREAFVDKVRELSPSFIGVFSVWPETYCHTLTEAWSVGVPALVGRVGTLEERLKKHGGGFLVPVDNVEAAYDVILRAIDDPALYHEERNRANLDGVRSVADMTVDYAELYDDVSQDGFRCLNPEDEKGGSIEVASRRRLRIGLVVPGTGQHHPGSTYVRVLNYARHRLAKSLARFTVIEPSSVLSVLRSERFDAILVQRTALNERTADIVVSQCQRAGIALIYEIDDDLLAVARMPENASEYGPFAPAIEKLLVAADAVILSTDALAGVYSQMNRRVSVVPNAVSERNWLGKANGWLGKMDVLSRNLPSSVRARRALYMGSATHAEDLLVISDALREVKGSLGIETHLIGVQHRSQDDSYCSRVQIPRDCRDYPQFVEWLRSTGPWDFALCPLAESVVNRSKSPLKFFEYSILGVPGIYSRNTIYDDVVRDGETGLLVGNDPAEWSEAMRRLGTDVELRNRIQEAAFDEVVARHLLKDRIHDWLEVIEGAVERTRSARKRSTVGKGSEEPAAPGQETQSLSG